MRRQCSVKARRSRRGPGGDAAAKGGGDAVDGDSLARAAAASTHAVRRRSSVLPPDPRVFPQLPDPSSSTPADGSCDFLPSGCQIWWHRLSPWDPVSSPNVAAEVAAERAVRSRGGGGRGRERWRRRRELEEVLLLLLLLREETTTMRVAAPGSGDCFSRGQQQWNFGVRFSEPVLIPC